MCTVTLFPNKCGYRLAMNRDEQLTRIAGLRPEIFTTDHRQVAHPREPGGGSWISVNDEGITFALINWYSISNRAPAPAVSRGQVILSVRHATSPDEVAAILAELPLRAMNPFRLIGVFPDRESVRQWQWNRQNLAELPHIWKPQQWISSGFDEPRAQDIRSQTFRAALQLPGAGDLAWLRTLHGSHMPQPGPFATCMHRSDAATVSYTEIDVTEETSLMNHTQGAPCCQGQKMEPSIQMTRVAVPSIPYPLTPISS